MSSPDRTDARVAANSQPIGKAALAKGVSEDLYDRVVIPINLTRGGSADLPSKS